MREGEGGRSANQVKRYLSRRAPSVPTQRILDILSLYQKLREASLRGDMTISEDGNSTKYLSPLWNDVGAMRVMCRTHVSG